MTELISARIPEETAQDIKLLAKARHTGKTEVIRALILQGLKEAKLEMSIQKYKEGKATLWKAAQLAGLSLWKFLDEVKKRKIGMEYTREEAQEEVKAVFG
ncbi:UPF0175 family protein [Candidatus Woesearchaeota archaeon]|nr:UPF0175 family protein [Candidatus Woesearchaeota archaeon]